MHGQHAAFIPDAALALQLGSHVPQHLVERGLAGTIRTKAIFMVTKQSRAATIGRDEDQLGWRSRG